MKNEGYISKNNSVSGMLNYSNINLENKANSANVRMTSIQSNEQSKIDFSIEKQNNSIRRKSQLSFNKQRIKKKFIKETGLNNHFSSSGDLFSKSGINPNIKSINLANESSNNENGFELDNLTQIQQMIILNYENQHIKDLIAAFRKNNYDSDSDFAGNFL